MTTTRLTLRPYTEDDLDMLFAMHRDPAVVISYMKTVDALLKDGFEVYEVPLEDRCRDLGLTTGHSGGGLRPRVPPTR